MKILAELTKSPHDPNKLIFWGPDVRYPSSRGILFDLDWDEKYPPHVLDAYRRVFTQRVLKEANKDGGTRTSGGAPSILAKQPEEEQKEVAEGNKGDVEEGPTSEGGFTPYEQTQNSVVEPTEEELAAAELLKQKGEWDSPTKDEEDHGTPTQGPTQVSPKE